VTNRCHRIIPEWSYLGVHNHNDQSFLHSNPYHHLKHTYDDPPQDATDKKWFLMVLETSMASFSMREGIKPGVKGIFNRQIRFSSKG